MVTLRKQHGQVVSVCDSQYSGPRFKSCSGHLLDSLSVIRVQTFGHACKRQLVAICQLGFLILLYDIWIFCL